MHHSYVYSGYKPPSKVAGEGIRVNAVRPGFMHADIHTSGGEPARVNRIGDSIPMKREGQPEVAQAILWLSSDESSFSPVTIIDISEGK